MYFTAKAVNHNLAIIHMAYEFMKVSLNIPEFDIRCYHYIAVYTWPDTTETVHIAIGNTTNKSVLQAACCLLNHGLT